MTYILVALQAVAGFGQSLFWQPIGEFQTAESCKAAMIQLQSAKQAEPKETYVCLKK